MAIEEMIKKCRVCAILRNLPMDIFPEYASAVYRGGIRMFEVTMNSENAEQQIAFLRSNLGGGVYVGAGTVTTKERAEKALGAGAQFFLAPSSDKDILDYCNKRKIPFLPGVMTPSDISLCLSYGYNVMKLFPFRSLPENYIKDLKGPFDETEFVAVGGVGAENIDLVFRQGYIGAGIGSNLIPIDDIRQKDWGRSEKVVYNLMDKIDSILFAESGA